MTKPSDKKPATRPSLAVEPKWEDLIVRDPAPGYGGAEGEAWTDAKPFPEVPSQQFSYVSGRRDSRAIRVRYFEKKSSKRFAGRAWFGPEAEGPPGHAHGGSQAALLDEGMGATAWLSGHPVLAAKIEINFRQPLPLGTTLTIWCEITKTDGRKVFTSGRLEGDDGTVYADGTGLFISIDAEALMRKAEVSK